MNRQTANPANEGTHTLRRIIDALDDLEFGAVEITVHQGRIVQIERREKLRFDKERRPSVATSESTTRD
ncbi:YezD family protein [Sedimenticola hydrogenitrophicus]|uniref:YezD family protein n=1 Tax=Sedimenticola hydrogenitrophicus TaxID=2967975 RepID=UPI0021A7AE5A|nr:YezD family protein [Sedimenticola hydrogenitrophicus]